MSDHDPLPPPQLPSESQTTPARSSWFGRLRTGIAKTSQQIGRSIRLAFDGSGRQERKQSMEEALLAADIGPTLARTLSQTAANSVDAPDAQARMYQEIVKILTPRKGTLDLLPPRSGLQVVLVYGINGGGKTTTCGKLAYRLRQQGYQVALIGADIFRAAALDQLSSWAQRVDCLMLGPSQATQTTQATQTRHDNSDNSVVVSGSSGSSKRPDVASVVFSALEEAKRRHVDVAIVDTAGRLHSSTSLMDELTKIHRIVMKQVPDPSHRRALLVLDGTVGQNALTQVRIFGEAVPIDTLVVTKLDGTTRAGIVVAIAHATTIPIGAVGVGEAPDDLQAFDPQAFAAALLDHHASPSL